MMASSGKVSIDAVIKACQSYYDKSFEEWVKRGKGRGERQVAIYLSKVLSGQKSKEIGKVFGIKGPAVSEVIKGIEGRLEKEIKLSKEIEYLREKLISKF
jgi:chromosomal replication initiation ATPase DnaA